MGAYPVYSGAGVARVPGRWNAADQPAIYASLAFSTALLEKLARLGELPSNQHRVEITLPEGLSYEELGPESLRGWDDHVPDRARAFGAAWFAQARSAVLIVPCVIAWPDRNVLINPDHPEADGITVGRETLVRWDERLFGGTS